MPASSSRQLLDTLGDAVWRGDALGHAGGRTQPTGHAALNAELPGGGWPVGALSEVLQAPLVHHEWRLLLPALVQTTGPVVLVGPPHMPFGPALGARGLPAQRLLWVQVDEPAQQLWAAEQALRCAPVSAVLVWLAQARFEALRRLHMTAHTHAKLLFVMRPLAAQSESSPAPLRLHLSGESRHGTHELLVHLLKRRGPPASAPLRLAAHSGALAAVLALSTPPAPPHAGALALINLATGGNGALDRHAARA